MSSKTIEGFKFLNPLHVNDPSPFIINKFPPNFLKISYKSFEGFKFLNSVRVIVFGLNGEMR